VHCWANLQPVHGFRCYDNIAPNAKCQRVLVLVLDLGLVSTVDSSLTRLEWTSMSAAAYGDEWRRSSTDGLTCFDDIL